MAVEESVFHAAVRRIAALEALFVPASGDAPNPASVPPEGATITDVIDTINSATSRLTELAARVTALEEAITSFQTPQPPTEPQTATT